MNWILVLCALTGICVVLGLVHSAFAKIKQKRLVVDLPTSKSLGVFIGLVELEGTTESDNPFSATFTKQPLVCHNWEVAEQWQRTETYTQTDHDGKTRQKTRTVCGWEILSCGSRSQVFRLKDEDGSIQVNPDKADIVACPLVLEVLTPSDSRYFEWEEKPEIPDTTHRRRFWEEGIPLHEQIYVAGRSRVRDDVVEAEIAYDPESPVFLISTESEKQIVRRTHRQFFTRYIAAIFVAAATCGFWGHCDPRFCNGTWGGALFGAGLLLACWPVGWLVIVVNSMIEHRNRVKAGWANLDVELQRRAELVPRLVTVVQKTAGHERETLALIDQLRNRGIPIDQTDAERRIACLNAKVLAVLEKYPVLKADEPFLQLHRTLVETEQRIALARRYYNDLVMNWNNRCQMFPERIFAWLCRMKEVKYLSFEDFERNGSDK